MDAKGTGVGGLLLWLLARHRTNPTLDQPDTTPGCDEGRTVRKAARQNIEFCHYSVLWNSKC